MSFWGTLLGGDRPPRVASAMTQRQLSREANRETLSLAVRQTLGTHGIPHSWLGAETVAASRPAAPDGLHLRLVIRHVHPDFLANLHALEREIHAALSQLDPEYARWAMGTSWRIEVPLGTAFHQLPGPSFWQPKTPALSGALPPNQSTTKQRVAEALQVRDSVFTKTTSDSPEFSPTQLLAAD
jgi:hypothetical protein